MCVHVSLCAYMCMSVYACLCVHMSVHVRASLCVFVHVSVCEKIIIRHQCAAIQSESEEWLMWHY